MNDWIDLWALAKIIIGGLICGAGLPALFALGLRALHMGARPAVPVAATGPSSRSALTGDGSDSAGGDSIVGGSSLGMVIAGLCFLVVLAAVVWGIYLIVAA